MLKVYLDLHTVRFTMYVTYVSWLCRLLKRRPKEIFDLFFSWLSFPRAPAGYIGAISIFTKIRGDIRNFLFIAGVNSTAEKMYTGVNEISDKTFVRVSVINWQLVCLHLEINVLEKEFYKWDGNPIE